MKYFPTLICFFICISLQAQQPKAYQMVSFKNAAQKLRFELDYAEGYLAASQIKLAQPRAKTQIFNPVSGTPEENGELSFRANSGATIKLLGIDQEATSPKSIKGTYRFKGKVLQILFYRTR